MQCEIWFSFFFSKTINKMMHGFMKRDLFYFIVTETTLSAETDLGLTPWSNDVPDEVHSAPTLASFRKKVESVSLWKGIPNLA